MLSLCHTPRSSVAPTIDGGDDPLDDDEVTGHVCDLLARPAPDVTLAYLVACDLAGHAHGWHSAGYASAARRTDALLGTMIDAAGPDVSIVVTSGHGGDHGEPVADTMTTWRQGFAAVAAARHRRTDQAACRREAMARHDRTRLRGRAQPGVGRDAGTTGWARSEATTPNDSRRDRTRAMPCGCAIATTPERCPASK